MSQAPQAASPASPYACGSPFQGGCSAALPRAAEPCCHPASHLCYCGEFGYHTLGSAYGN